MKKIVLFFCLTVTLISTSSFTNKEELLAKTCDYKMYNSSGQYLGDWSINVPDNMSCGSKEAKALAVADYNVWN